MFLIMAQVECYEQQPQYGSPGGIRVSPGLRYWLARQDGLAPAKLQQEVNASPADQYQYNQT
jgi:hypothetical protein